jgi:hypothetical protein
VCKQNYSAVHSLLIFATLHSSSIEILELQKQPPNPCINTFSVNAIDFLCEKNKGALSQKIKVPQDCLKIRALLNGVPCQCNQQHNKLCCSALGIKAESHICHVSSPLIAWSLIREGLATKKEILELE